MGGGVPLLWLSLRIPDEARLTHPVVLSMESDCSDCSRAWEASEGAGSGSGFRMRNKRKQPTRLITVREMNTVWRSLSETWVRVRQHLLLVGRHLTEGGQNTRSWYNHLKCFIVINKSKGKCCDQCTFSPSYLLYEHVHARHSKCKGFQKTHCRQTEDIQKQEQRSPPTKVGRFRCCRFTLVEKLPKICRCFSRWCYRSSWW